MEVTFEGVDYNPWTTDACTANLRNAVLLAQRTGHFIGHAGKQGEQLLAEMASMKQINLQREISRVRKELNKVNLEIQKKMQHHETRDITEVKIVEERTDQMKSLSDHVQSLTTHKDALISRLQQPFVGDYFKLEASYHKEACEVFNKLAPVLSHLTLYLDDLRWINKQDFSGRELDDLLTELSSTLASLQTSFQTVMNMAHHISVMHCEVTHRPSITHVSASSFPLKTPDFSLLQEPSQ